MKQDVSSFLRAFLPLAILLAAACKNPQAASGSDIKDLGTMKTGIDAVAVYWPNQQTKLWDRSSTRKIQSGDAVWTVDDGEGRPKTYPVKDPETGRNLQLVEVVFRGPQQQDWTKGFVLKHCLEWDTSKKLAQGEAANAKPVDVKSLDNAVAGKQKPKRLCGSL